MEIQQIDKLVSQAKELQQQIEELNTLAKTLSDNSVEGKLILNLGETRPSVFPKELGGAPQDHPLRQLWAIAAPKTEPVLHRFTIDEVDGLYIISHLLTRKQKVLTNINNKLKL